MSGELLFTEEEWNAAVPGVVEAMKAYTCARIGLPSTSTSTTSGYCGGVSLTRCGVNVLKNVAEQRHTSLRFRKQEGQRRQPVSRLRNASKRGRY